MKSSSTNGHEPRAMIVDDEPDGAYALGVLLRMRGFAVQVEIEATLCLPHLEAFNPDVILLDIAMPRMSGYELARQIRAQSQFNKIAIISMSGYCDQQHEQWALDAGCNRHVVKPLDLATIEGVIADVVRLQLLAQN